MTDPLIRRRDAAQATLDSWRNRPFRLGTSDCVRLAASHLRLMGYQVRLPPSGSYRSIASATAALRRLGHQDVAAALDSMGLPRIVPAQAIVGDLLMVPAEHDLGGLAVVLPNGRIVGYHEQVKTGADVLHPVLFVAAWRVDPR